MSSSAFVQRRDAGPTALLGRTREREALERLLDDVREGRSAVLLIRGEAGVGKTELLRHVTGQAAGFRVARVTGVEAETDLPYAGIHQLCGPLLGQLDGLPPPQREALTIAFGLASGDAPDRFLVGLAVLTLLSAGAAERPLLCLVDNAQWLDDATSTILGFIARRAPAEPVAILVAVREPVSGHALDGLPELRVEGLSGDHARELLASAVPGRLDERVRDRLIAETRGNPRALLEAPRRMTAAELAGGFEAPVSHDRAASVEDGLLRHVAALPEATQRLLLLASADPLGDPTLVWRAARKLGIDISALAPAEDAELLQIGAWVRFRHPVVRSAVYGAASGRNRQRVHEALAEVSDPESDADRRAWHRSLAVAGRDEAVAAELERSAGRAQARGGIAATAAFLQRAVALTEDPAPRRRRALAAAEASLDAGAFDQALSMLAAAAAGTLDEGRHARIDMLRAQVAFAAGRGTEAAPLLLAAARRLAPLDAALARETYVDAFFAAIFGGRLNDGHGMSEVARAARAATREGAAEPRTGDLLLDALIALAEDEETAAARSRAAVSRVAGEDGVPLRRLWQGSVVALEVWDDDRAYELSRRSVEMARERTTLAELAFALSAHTPLLVLGGELPAAAAHVAESRSVEDATGISAAPYGALVLEAWRGRPHETRALVEATTREAGARGEGLGVAMAQYARAVLCNGLGEYEEALAAAVSASEHRELVVENWGLGELVEAATRNGRRDLALDGFHRLARKARATEADWALGLEARARALLGAGADADGAFAEAIERLSRTRVRAELARTRLLYGEWLRRANRRVDARAQLRAAHGEFTSMGMEAFAERARAELGATGETVRRSSPETRDELTPHERQIAELAREGLSNPEIGARLFLSPRTVEWHLRNVFVKLGIRSRRQLATALAPSHATPRP